MLFELMQLKTELAALDRKITAELAPKHDENDGTEVKQVQSQQSQFVANTEMIDSPSSSPSQKSSMVAEPTTEYKLREPLSSRIVVGGCGATPPGGFRARPKL